MSREKPKHMKALFVSVRVNQGWDTMSTFIFTFFFSSSECRKTSLSYIEDLNLKSIK